ncbi:Uma2 family endonuclease [Singulisphaera sp. Ch08]|uniref:Uma2 family endonuclease n=1 Tax=Singulisphaera sp. Ch08 TaxID=3120278 RepID=A0AAU7CHC7_9BACT
MASSSPLYETYRFSVEDYHRMAEAGILVEDARVELIEGEIVTKRPIGSRHLACVDRLTGLLARGVGFRAILRVQGSIRLGDRSEPEPDLVLLRPRQDYYAAIPATPGDVLTLIEVMDSSAGYDREIKLGLYAREEVAEVWLVDLNKEWIEVHRRPISGVHTEIQIRPRGESVSPEAFPDLVLAVDSILG